MKISDRTAPLRRPLGAAIALACGAALAGGQGLELPKKSPHAVCTQVVGVTKLSVDYHRPQVKGRTVWGDVVPYGEIWRAGANENTVFETADPVRVGDVKIPAGRYGLHVIPQEASWTVVFNEDANQWGSYSYDESKDAARVEVRPQPVEHCESLTYAFTDIHTNGATLALRWEKLEARIPIHVATGEIVMAKIRETMAKGPERATVASAIGFALQYETGLDEALEWSETALSQEETADFVVWRTAVLEALGRTEEYEDGLAVSLELLNGPRELGNTGASLARLGRHTIALRFLEPAAELAPQSPQLWQLLGDSHLALGHGDEALTCYRKGLETSPPDFLRGVLERSVAKLERETRGS